MDRKEEIKKIIEPHFGYLKLYLSWNVSLDKIEEFHQITKTDKEIVKRLPKPLNEYTSYGIAIRDILRLKKDTELKRLFKDGLNGKSRSFFKNTITDSKLRKKYEYLSNNKQKLEMFFRTSSKPQTIEDYIKYISDVISFDDTFINIVNRIEDKIDYITAEDGAYVFKLKDEYLNMVPSCWCIYNNPHELKSWSESQQYDSIWLVVNPYHKNPHRRMVGVDIHKDYKTIEYMDSLNDRITDSDIPISRDEFFKIARNRLSNKEIDLGDKFTQDMLDDIYQARNKFYEESAPSNPYMDDIYSREKKLHYDRYLIKRDNGSYVVNDTINKVILNYVESYEEGEKYLEDLLTMRGEI
jgi:hypothetical protein